MRELKSVRVRKDNNNSGVLDIKVSLFEDSKSKFILMGINNGNTIWTTSYKRDGIFKDFSNDDFINNFITLQSKIDNSKYSIIQDPWQESVPKFRIYGFEPYYLNNGSVVYISWVDGVASVGGRKYSNSDGDEINVDTTILKQVKIIYNENNIIIKIDNDGSFKYSKDIKSDKEYSSTVKDIDILKEVIGKWNSMIPGYSLELCSLNNESCSLIDFKDPLNIKEVKDPVLKERNEDVVNKIRLNVTLPTEKLKVKFDFSIKVLLGDIKTKSTDDYIFNDSDTIDPEYTENPFEGMDEAEFIIQDDVASFQEDSDANLVSPGVPANIRPTTSLDSLLRLAGDCARELGKNPRVNYKNLRSGYIKGVHGLCPQGTLSVLYALTGIKSIGSIRGDANYYSFSSRGGNRGSLSSTGYFKDKVRVGISDYINNPQSWQVGDVIACDYTKASNKKYGHIQVWTGYCWMSDFKQNKIQVNNVDFSTVALWRLNDNGVSVVRSQTKKSSIV